MSDSASLSAQVNKLNVNEQASSDVTHSDLIAVVDDLLNHLGSKFSNMSSELIGKMEEMSRRLDNLEATIQAGNAQDGEGEK